MVAYLSVIVCIAGALLYAFLEGKGSELGRLMFACGLLVFLFSVSGQTAKLF